MGRDLAKRMFLVLTPILLLPLFIPSSSVNSSENGVCIPKSADLELKERLLDLHGETTCSASQMQATSLAVENLSTYGEADKDCLGLFELLEYPNVGIQSESTRVCASFCDRVFEACSDAYFSSNEFFDNRINATKLVMVRCGEIEGIVICRKVSKWESNGTSLCNAMGFTVQIADDSEGEPCYGSYASLEPVIESEPSEEVELSGIVLVQLMMIWWIVAIVIIRWLDRQERLA